MLTKTISYKDFNDVEREETFYFNLTESELVGFELDLTAEGGLGAYVKRLVETKNAPELFKLFKKLLLMAYGEKSSDGRRFVKSEEITTAFTQTEAYNKLFMELTTDANAAAAFVNGIVPKSLSAQ